MQTSGQFGRTRPNQFQTALIALGSNQSSVAGGPRETVRSAIENIEKMGAEVISVSSFYSTYAYPAGAGPDFINATAKISLKGDAHNLMDLLHRVEATLGRERSQRWGPRTIDLDLLAVGQLVLPDLQVFNRWRHMSVAEQAKQAPQQLILPHPRIQDRSFVLVPLADIAPEWVHPVLGRSVLEMLSDLPEDDRTAVKRLE